MKGLVLSTMIAITLATEYRDNNAQSVPAPVHQEIPTPFQFSWIVLDDSSDNDYAHEANSDGDKTTGSYYVVLPDGRTQTVTYKASDRGYVAEIKYKGEDQYPQYKAAASFIHSKASYYEPYSFEDSYPPIYYPKVLNKISH